MARNKGFRPTRRQFIGAVSAAMVMGKEARADQSKSLAGLAARDGRYFGTAIRPEQLEYEPDLRAVVLGQCNCLTPELALKWDAAEPVEGDFQLYGMDKLAAFASSNTMKLRGHALIWHKSTPQWAAKKLAEEKNWTLVRRHFGTIIPRYKGVVDEWDVVNEPIDIGYRSDGLRDNVFLKAFGPDYIRAALEEARMAAGGAQLMINEFGLEYDVAVENRRRYAFLKLIERLKTSGAPLDGVGLQAHLDLGKGPFPERKYADFLAEIAAFGVKIVITELDVKEHTYTLPAEQRDEQVARETKKYLDVALAQPAVKGVVTWGLSDRHSWLEVTKEDLARFPNAWKTGEGPGFNRGLPFDSSMRPKMMYRAIESAFLRQPLN